MFNGLLISLAQEIRQDDGGLRGRYAQISTHISRGAACGLICGRAPPWCWYINLTPYLIVFPFQVAELLWNYKLCNLWVSSAAAQYHSTAIPQHHSTPIPQRHSSPIPQHPNNMAPLWMSTMPINTAFRHSDREEAFFPLTTWPARTVDSLLHPF